jgi:hypothetical protein
MYLSSMIGFCKWKCIENLEDNQKYLKVNCKKKEVFYGQLSFLKEVIKKL